MKKPPSIFHLPSSKSPRVAIVHDWLIGGGAEKVVLELHHMFPDAPIYTSYSTDEWRRKLDNKVVTGYLQNWPFSALRKFLPVLRQRWFGKLDLADFDLVISSSGNGEAKHIRVGSLNIEYRIWQKLLRKLHIMPRVKKPSSTFHLPPSKPVHICYCHTPTHFYWRHYDDYLRNPSFRPKWLARLGLKLLVAPLRERDFAAAQKVDYFIANSSHIQADIQQFYGKDATVIHPPVDTKRFAQVPPSPVRKGFVTVGRQVPYKRIDIIVQACNQLQLPLTVIGRGPEHNNLVSMAGPTITFKTDVTDGQMPRELAAAEAFIFAAFEDFGVAPVEALAAGTPVIAYKAGGALDYVIPGKTGEFFDEQTAGSLIDALKAFDVSLFDRTTIQKQAAEFSSEHFQKKMLDIVNNSVL